MSPYDIAKEWLAKRIAESLLTLAISGIAVAEAWYWNPLAIWLTQSLGPLALAKLLLVLFPLLLVVISYCWYLYPRHKFRADVGIYFNPKTGMGYCPRCHSSRNKWSPLKQSATSFSCTACGAWFGIPQDPNKPKSPPNETSWMGR